MKIWCPSSLKIRHQMRRMARSWNLLRPWKLITTTNRRRQARRRKKSDFSKTNLNPDVWFFEGNFVIIILKKKTSTIAIRYDNVYQVTLDDTLWKVLSKVPQAHLFVKSEALTLFSPLFMHFKKAYCFNIVYLNDYQRYQIADDQHIQVHDLASSMLERKRRAKKF